MKNHKATNSMDSTISIWTAEVKQCKTDAYSPQSLMKWNGTEVIGKLPQYLDVCG